LNKILLLAIIFCTLSYTGCATTTDLEKTERKFDTEISALQDENAGMGKAMARNDQAIADIRKRIADIAADMTEIREDLENLRGDREVLGKGESDMRKEFADIRGRYDQLSARIKTMENLLEIGSGASEPAKGEKVISGEPKSAVPGEREKEVYGAAYQAFKEEKYEEARKGFQNFLKQYPNTEYSDSAQFWIGEGYYFERNYEQAILEYEKVIKNYPQGNKAPNALLKQGFAFLNIGDKSSAKLLFEQVERNYPGTSQARMAKAKLAEIK